LRLITLTDTHTHTHTLGRDYLGWRIGPSQRPLPDNTQHSQETHIHDTCGIRASSPSKRAAADVRCRPYGHRDRPRRFKLSETNVKWLLK